MSLFVRALLCAAAGSIAACASSASPSPAATPAASDPSASEAAPAPSEGDSSAPPRGKRAPCTLGADQSCNEDPKVSALWGHCTELGVCECKPGFERSPTSDLCRPAQ
jgi:hypothetical protein